MKRYILITGSTDGIGLSSAKEFAKMGKNIVIHGKNIAKINKTKQILQDINPEINIKAVQADFCDLTKTKQSFLKIANLPIDTLINNAGIFSKSLIKTKDGYELTYQVNHLAHFLITHILIDTLLKNQPSKIIIVSSMAHATYIDKEMIKNTETPASYEGYSISKLCNILFCFKLSKIYKDISINCIHPGVVNTKLLIDNWGACGIDAKDAYKMILFACNLENNITGKYLKDFKIEKAANTAYDEKMQDFCYETSLKQIENFL
jgi:NAD(P)-dependent dehydrogenase (short-subunit alcohol dehydrogenase family)